MAATRRKTDEVLASARKELQAQLGVVREELGRLAAEEHALTEALSSLDGDRASPSATAPASKTGGRTRTSANAARKSSTRKAGTSRRRRPRSASKPTADRVEELRRLLADGPKSRNDLAAALKVSPARVQQLLAELGNSVSSEPDPEQRQGKLWSLSGSGNAAIGAKRSSKRGGGTAKAASARKPSARTKAAAN